MSQTPANWYPDPLGRHEVRYWDGAAWTEHVSNQGVTGSDPMQMPAPTGDRLDRLDAALGFGDKNDAARIGQQISASGHRGAGITNPGAGGGGTIFDEPILVVNQKAKIIELNNQYAVFNQAGQQVAAVNQVGQSTAKKMLRLVSNVDQFLTHKYEVTSPQGGVLLRITRPAKLIKSTVIVSNANDVEIGRIVQENMFGKIHFGLESQGQRLGAIKAENWRAWNFRIEDASGQEVARVTKTWEGLGKAVFTTADNYVVQIHQRQPEPLNSLIVASALSIDTALKQDDK